MLPSSAMGTPAVVQHQPSSSPASELPSSLQALKLALQERYKEINHSVGPCLGCKFSLLPAPPAASTVAAAAAPSTATACFCRLMPLSDCLSCRPAAWPGTPGRTQQRETGVEWGMQEGLGVCAQAMACDPSMADRCTAAWPWSSPGAMPAWSLKGGRVATCRLRAPQAAPASAPAEGPGLRRQRGVGGSVWV